jgi:hypothetical protein
VPFLVRFGSRISQFYWVFCVPRVVFLVDFGLDFYRRFWARFRLTFARPFGG